MVSSFSIYDFWAAWGGQSGLSMPNCLAYSAFNRCQPPNFIASAPTMRPIGSPARSRSSTSKQMCQPAAPHGDEAAIDVVPERQARAAAERLELPAEIVATPVVLEQPRRSARFTVVSETVRRRPDRRELHRPDGGQVPIGVERRPFATAAPDRSAPARPSPADDAVLGRG